MYLACLTRLFSHYKVLVVSLVQPVTAPRSRGITPTSLTMDLGTSVMPRTAKHIRQNDVDRLVPIT